MLVFDVFDFSTPTTYYDRHYELDNCQLYFFYAITGIFIEN